LLTLATLAALVSLGVFGAPRRVQAQADVAPIPDRISFGMVGLTRGQTIRLNVVNTLPATSFQSLSPTTSASRLSLSPLKALVHHPRQAASEDEEDASERGAV